VLKKKAQGPRVEERVEVGPSENPVIGAGVVRDYLFMDSACFFNNKAIEMKN